MTMTAMDYEDIRQLQARYSFAVDFGDRAAFEACFAPDGTFAETGLPEGLPDDIHLQGRPALGDFVEGFFGSGQGHLRHWSSPPLIEDRSEGRGDGPDTGRGAEGGEGDSGEATGMSFLMVLRPGSAPDAGVLLTGVYRDRYRKIGGRWYFAERVFTADPQPEHRGNRSKDPLVGRLDSFVAGARAREAVRPEAPARAKPVRPAPVPRGAAPPVPPAPVPPSAQEHPYHETEE
jgi:hypothetical protein